MNILHFWKKFFVGEFLRLNFGPLGAIIGGGLCYLGARKTAKATENAARMAADASRFNPYNVQTGLGGATFSGGTASGMLSPQYAALAQRLQQLSTAGLEDLPDRQAAAERIYSDITSLTRPQEEETRLNLENRLLGQGMMGYAGASGMNPQTQALENALAQARTQRALAAFTGADAMRQSQINQSLGFLNAAMGLEQSPLDAISLGANIGGRATTAAGNSARLLANAQMANAANRGMFLANLGQSVGPAIGNYLQNRGPAQSQFTGDSSANFNPNMYIARSNVTPIPTRFLARAGDPTNQPGFYGT